MAERNVFTLKCKECSNQNYFFHLPKKKRGDRVKVEVKKFCSACGRHNLHKEAKL